MNWGVINGFSAQLLRCPLPSEAMSSESSFDLKPETFCKKTCVLRSHGSLSGLPHSCECALCASKVSLKWGVL